MSQVQSLRSLSFKSLTWSYAFRHRRLALITAAVIVLETVWFAFAGYELQSEHGASAGYAPLTKCIGASCSRAFKAPPPFIAPITTLLVFLIPALTALVLVLPSLAKEVESGSLRFTWTQSISRVSWLGSRIANAILATVLIVGVDAIETSRWIFPHEYGFFPWQNFAFRGVAVLGLSLFLVATGVLVALWTRRQIATVLITACIFGVAAILISDSYSRLLSPVSVVLSPGSNPNLPQSSLVVSSPYINRSGKTLPSTYVNKVMASCSQDALAKGTARAPRFNVSTFSSCLGAHNVYERVNYLPESRYGELQGIYAGATTGAAVIVLVLGFKVVRRMDI